MNIVSVQFFDNRVLPRYTEWTISQVRTGKALFMAVGGVRVSSLSSLYLKSEYSDYLYLFFGFFKMNRWICEQAIWDSSGFSKTILAFCLVFFSLIGIEGCCCSLVTKSCLTLSQPVDSSPPGPSVHGISQARTLEWVAISFSREYSPTRDPGHICIGRWILHHWATREAHWRLMWHKDFLEEKSFQVISEF